MHTCPRWSFGQDRKLKVQMFQLEDASESRCSHNTATSRANAPLTAITYHGKFKLPSIFTCLTRLLLQVLCGKQRKCFYPHVHEKSFGPVPPFPIRHLNSYNCQITRPAKNAKTVTGATHASGAKLRAHCSATGGGGASSRHAHELYVHRRGARHRVESESPTLEFIAGLIRAERAWRPERASGSRRPPAS